MIISQQKIHCVSRTHKHTINSITRGLWPGHWFFLTISVWTLSFSFGLGLRLLFFLHLVLTWKHIWFRLQPLWTWTWVLNSDWSWTRLGGLDHSSSLSSRWNDVGYCPADSSFYSQCYWVAMGWGGGWRMGGAIIFPSLLLKCCTAYMDAWTLFLSHKAINLEKWRLAISPFAVFHVNKTPREASWRPVSILVRYGPHMLLNRPLIVFDCQGGSVWVRVLCDIGAVNRPNLHCW